MWEREPARGGWPRRNSPSRAARPPTRPSTTGSDRLVSMDLASRITDRSARIAIIGCGYVGLPLAMSFVSAGFHVTGIDVDERRIGQLRRGESYIADVPSSQLKAAVDGGL